MSQNVITPELNKLLVEAIRQVSGKSVADLRFEQPIAELGLDSVAVMEMVGSLEETLSLHFSDDELARINTFGDLAQLVQRTKAAQSAA